jgi:TonB family protein
MTPLFLMKLTFLLALAWMLSHAPRTAAMRHLTAALGLLAALLLPLYPLLDGMLALPAWNSGVPLPALPPAIASGIEITVTASRASALPDPLLVAWASGTALLLLRLLIAFLRTPRANQNVPMVSGLWKPRVILPPDFARWTPEQRAAVLAHEQAHIARGDTRWQLLAHLATAVYWFHPLAWILSRRLRQEAERACDDAVVRSGGDAPGYAAFLLSLSRERLLLEPSAVSMIETPLEGRLMHILNSQANRTPLTRRAASAAVVLALGATLATGAFSFAAQNGPASLRIRVLDPSTAAVPQAKVTLKGLDGTAPVVAHTADDGYCDFASLTPGGYEMRIEKAGFAAVLHGVKVASGKSTLVRILRMGSIQETVGGATMRIRVGGNVQATKIVQKLVPQYPAAAKQQGIQGAVQLMAVISAEGDVLSLNVLESPSELLSESALTAVRQWKYEPTLLNGKPVEVATQITVNYTLAP